MPVATVTMPHVIPAAPKAVRAMHDRSLLNMLAYCENVGECRRKLLVEHFGEAFDAAHCQQHCDVCSSPVSTHRMLRACNEHMVLRRTNTSCSTSPRRHSMSWTLWHRVPTT